MDKNHHASRNPNHTLIQTTPTSSRSKKIKIFKTHKIPLENNGIQLAELRLGQMKSINASSTRNENSKLLIASKKPGQSMKNSKSSTRRKNDRAGVYDKTSIKLTKSN